MSIDFTPFFKPYFRKIALRTAKWKDNGEHIQKVILRSLLARAAETEYGKKYGFGDMIDASELYKEFSENVPLIEYEDIRPEVMRMINGEKNILWKGECKDFAQSSGTSGGKSKYIPITKDSLTGNHYRGGEDAVAHYIKLNPATRIFSGKGLILGGSFANTLAEKPANANVGDLSATLINRINPLANLVRVPDKKTALLPDWEQKLPALIENSKNKNITNISGVPSWFLTFLLQLMNNKGKSSLKEVWPNLEVFFHGGISFEPYREEYKKITEGLNMHFLETYNASEGFFAVQNDFDDKSMLLIIDRDVFYEFIPLDHKDRRPLPLWEVKEGNVYELVISSSNGLWRYRLGDTVRITQTNPVKITIAGRTKSFINAFGEELMEDNAEKAIGMTCEATGARILNYSVAPVFPEDEKKGRHQWLIEWETEPFDIEEFARNLDLNLQKLNSDYEAKRSHTIFLDPPEIITARQGLFNDWLKSAGNHKLGGQRKVPRLSNERILMERLLELNYK